MARPVLYVLAGVNGAGKSSIGGYLLKQAGLSWYNPDDFARALVSEYGLSQSQANGQAWQEGMRRLDQSVATRRAFAFETTLGGHTVAQRLYEAAKTHDVMIWYCGLRTVQMHLDRVRLRVRQGGHDIPRDKIRQRWEGSMKNLVGLLPMLAHLRVYDNSQSVEVGQPIGELTLLLEMQAGKRCYPATAAQARDTPHWAKPILEAAFELDPER